MKFNKTTFLFALVGYENGYSQLIFNAHGIIVEYTSIYSMDNYYYFILTSSVLKSSSSISTSP